MLRLIRTVLLAALLAGLGPAALFADFADEIVFRSGQKVSGDIKRLELGKLTYKTDEMGIVSVLWDKITGISSPNRFRVETEWGQRLVGSLEVPGEAGKVVIATDHGKVLLALSSIVFIYPIDRKLLGRFRGYLDVGFSLQRAQKLASFTLGTDVSYSTSRWALSFSANSYFSRREGVEDTTRNDASFKVERAQGKRLVLIGVAQVQQNRELGLSRRLMLGAGIGNRFIRTNSMTLTVAIGLIGIDELYRGSAAADQNLEAIITSDFSVFRYTSPKLDFTVGLDIIPNLTDWGRWRAEFRPRVSYEIFKHFYVSLSGFYTVDSRPPIEGTPKRDYGVFSSVRWEF